MKKLKLSEIRVQLSLQIYHRLDEIVDMVEEKLFNETRNQAWDHVDREVRVVTTFILFNWLHDNHLF